MKNGWKTYSLVVLMSSAQFACSGQSAQFLKSMNVSVTQQNSEEFINLTAEVNLGNSTLASLTIPVYDPHTNSEIGQVTFGQAADGNQQITVSVDASSILHADPTLGLTLPNGLPIPPSLGATTGSLLAFPILNSSRVYIGGDLKTNIIVGAAFGIPGLDSIMSKIGFPGNILFSQTFNTNLSGMAGIYASPNVNQNGIAVFAKANIPATATPTPGPTALAATTAASTTAASNTAKVAVRSLAMVTNTGTPSATSFASVSVSGVTPASGNTMVNENVNSKHQNKLLNYFYGSRKTLRPH